MIRRYRHITQRPDTFRLNPDAELVQGLVFAGLAPGGLVGSTHYHDSSLYGNHGTLTNGPGWDFDSTLGRFVLDLTAQGQYVTAPSVGLGTADFSISAWVNRNASSAYVASIVSQGDTGADEWMARTYAPSSSYQFYGGAGAISASAASWTADQWGHVLFARTAGVLGIWVNGTYVARDETATTDLSTTKPLQIGGADSDSTRWFVGKLSDIMIWRGVALGIPLQQSAFAQQLADPSNTLLSGLILPPRRVMFPAAVAGGIPEGYASLSAVADIAAVGYAERSGSAPLSAVASLAAAGYRESVGTAELVVVASVDAVGCAESAAAASLDAVASISAIGYATHSGATELAAIGGITAAGYAEAYASAELSAVAGLTAVGESPSAIPDGYAALTAEADLAAVGYAQHSGSATLSAIADMVAVGEAPSIIPEGSATLSAIADLAAVGYASHAGEAALDAVADIAAVGYRESAGYAVLAAVADLVAVGSAPGEEGAGTGGKTADGLTWPDVDGLTWEEVDGLPWTHHTRLETEAAAVCVMESEASAILGLLTDTSSVGLLTTEASSTR